MTKTAKDLAEMQEITKDIIKTAVKADEYAIAEYVRRVCEQMSAVGEDLKQYNLARTIDNRDVMNMQVIYSIEKKEQSND